MPPKAKLPYRLTVLNHRQEQFVRNLLKGRTRTAAAIEAGYSPRTARAIGPELCNRPHVYRRIQELRAIVAQVLDSIPGIENSGDAVPGSHSKGHRHRSRDEQRVSDAKELP